MTAQTYEERIAAIVAEVVAYEWHSVLENGKLKYSHRVEPAELWAEIDRQHGRAPDKAITQAGGFWIMNSYFERTKGLCVRLVAGCSSQFTVAERTV